MAVTEGSEAFDSDIVQEVRSFFYGCNRALGYRLFWRHLPEMSEAMDGEILAGVKVWFDSFSSHFMDSDEEVKRHVCEWNIPAGLVTRSCIWQSA